jgi:hypothetical protein
MNTVDYEMEADYLTVIGADKSVTQPGSYGTLTAYSKHAGKKRVRQQYNSPTEHRVSGGESATLWGYSITS